MINLSIPMDQSSTHNKEQFGGCLIKITYILKILKGLNEMLQISTNLSNFWCILQINILCFRAILSF